MFFVSDAEILVVGRKDVSMFVCYLNVTNYYVNSLLGEKVCCLISFLRLLLLGGEYRLNILGKQGL